VTGNGKVAAPEAWAIPFGFVVCGKGILESRPKITFQKKLNKASLSTKMNQHTHELEKNELVEWSKKKLEPLFPHARTGLILLIGVVALIFGLTYYFQLQSQIRAEKWRQLHSAIYSMNDMQNASGLELVKEESPDTPTSHAAMLIAGDAYLKLGLQKMINDRAIALKELKKAKESLTSIIESKSKPSELIETRALYALAYACESLGEFDEAKTHYTSLTEKYKDSAFAKQANRGLERLADPRVRQVYDQFKTVAVAPGTALPKRPDISFPSIDAPATDAPVPGAGEEKKSEDKAAADAPKTDEPKTDAPKADEPKAEEKKAEEKKDG
jgi:tetratricopeptide (TPR) repeat protein